MTRYTIEEKYEIVRRCCEEKILGETFFWSVGTCNIDLCRKIAKSLGMKDNTDKIGSESLTKRITKMFREFIQCGYPIHEEKSLAKLRPTSSKYYFLFVWDKK